VVTVWHLPASSAEIATILADIEDIARWWSTCYRRARVSDEGKPCGHGRCASIESRGPAGRMLCWECTIHRPSPAGFRFEASGDLVGAAEWRLAEQDDVTRVELHWWITPSGPWRLARPLYDAHHRARMREGERCLCAELKRRRRLLQPAA
jgi:hypothetical protein